MRLRTRVHRLERLLPGPPPPTPEALREQRRWTEVVRRFVGGLERALPLLAESEQRAVQQALEDHAEGRGGALTRWLRDLRAGRCRLPGLAPEAMKALLLGWFHPDADSGMVCNQCGLEYPHRKSPPLGTWRLLPGKVPFRGPPPWYDLPRLFDACPGCGASTDAMTWSHLTGDADLPWKALDGWVGRDGR